MVGARGVFIGLGSNLGERGRHIRDALREMAADGRIQVVACSTLHETQPVGGPAGQPRYLNAVAELATDLSPRELLGRLQEIERRHGRQRGVRNASRTLDLDILIFRDVTLAEPDLHIPHPRMWQRSFVLEPLAEICDLAQCRRASPPSPQPDTEAGPHVRGHSGRTEALA